MTSKRPYLVRAMWQWIIDNNSTPHIVVDCVASDINVPHEHIKEGKMVLNISQSAAHNLELRNDFVSFQARFNKVPYDVVIPTGQIIAIYDRETGRGMIFGDAEAPNEPIMKETKYPHLKVVK